MPELPEVETVVRTLEHQLQHPTIASIDIPYANVIDNVSVEEFKKIVVNQTIQQYQRLGKYLIFRLDTHYMIAHMRMEGKFYVQDTSEKFDKKHIHIRFHFQDGRELRYHDTRKFGRFYVYPIVEDITTYSCFKNVGYDAFDERLDATYIYKASRKKQITLKQFLLDQRVIAGIGNIYADEICFRIGLHPKVKAGKLSKVDCEHILEATRYILSGAIKSGGTTIRSYTSSLGVDGRFQLKLKVHDKKGMPCSVCGTPIEKIVVGGRGTCFCKICQRKK